MWTYQEKYSCMFWHISLFFYPSRYNPYTIEAWVLFNVWVTENRIRAILPLYFVYMFSILVLSGMCSCLASLGGLSSRGSSIVMGGTGQPPEWGLGVWILQLRCSSCSHGWNVTLVTGHNSTLCGRQCYADSEDVSILYRGQQEEWFELQFFHWNEARDYSL